MARKPTLAEQRQALLYSPFSQDELQDPRVQTILDQQKKQEEEKKAAAQRLQSNPFANVQSQSDTVAGPQPSYMERANTQLGQQVGNAWDLLKNAGLVAATDVKSSLAQNKEVELQTQMSLQPDQIAAAQQKADQLRAQGQASGDQFGQRLIVQADAIQKQIDDAKMVQADPAGAAIALKQATDYRRMLTDQGAAANAALDKADPSHLSSILANLVGHPEQVAPMAGGLVGGILGGVDTVGVGAPAGAQIGSAITSGPMIKASYNEAFLRARDQGATFDQADKYAQAHAKTVAGVNVLGGGAFGAISREGGQLAVENLTKHLLKKTAVGGATGYGFGVANEAATLATDKLQSKGRDKIAEIANSNLPSTAVEVFNRLNAAGVSNAVAGGLLSSVHSGFEVYSEAGRDSVRTQRVRNQYADKPRYDNAITPELPGIAPASDFAGPEAGRPTVTRNPGPTMEDAKHLQLLNDNITVLEDKIAKGKGTTEDAGRLAFLKGARARLVGMDKPRMVGNKVVEPGLGLDYPAQPLSPEFTGLPNGEPARSTAEPIPAVAAKAATPVGGTGKGIPMGNNPKPGKTNTTSKAKGTVAPSGVTSADQFAAMRAKLGNAQLVDGTTDTTVKDVIDRITSGSAPTRTTDQRTITKLVHDKNLEVVPDESHIPAGAEKTGAGGFYDGNRTYVVANKLSKDNLMGDLLNVAAHEVHHAAGRSGAVTMRGFVGDKAVDSTISKLEAAAAKDDPVAKTAVERARAAEEANPGSYKEEVIPYAINAARTLKGRSSVGTRILGELTSAVRTKAKKFVGSSDINLKDIAYLSDKLLQEAAIQGQPMTSADKSGRSMIVSNGTSADLALKENRTWLSADGHRKYEISDHKSKFTIPDGALEGGSLKLPEVLHHPELYKDIPFMKDVNVYFGDIQGGDIAAMFQPSNNTIYINRSFLGTNPNAYNSEAHKNIIHEAQHAAQYGSGTTGGANIVKFLSPEGEKLANQLDEAYSNLNYVRTHGHGTVETVKFLRQEIGRLKTAYDPYFQEAYNKYVRVLGETEANMSMDNIPVTDAERRADTTDIGTNPEALNLKALGKIYNQKGKLIAEYKPKGLASNLQGFEAHLQDNVDAAAPIFRKQKVFFAKTFTPTQGRGDVLNEIIHSAAGEQSSLALTAEQKINQVWDAIKANVKSGLNEEDIIKDVHDSLDLIDQEPNINVRKSRVNALDRKYPGVGRALNVVRDFKKELTDAIIEQRSRDPKPLTDKEEAIYNKMLENDERYNTRAYLATLGGKTSTKYSEAVLREFHANPDSASGHNVTEAMDFLVDKHLTIPDADTLSNMKDADLRRMYQTWFGKTPKMRGERAREKMVSELSGLPPKTEAEIKAKAYEVVKDLLGLNENATAIATYFRGGKQNRTILESRKNVPEPIRNLLGEITHPVVREMVSLMRMSTLIYKTQMLTDIFENTKGTEWSDTVSKDHPMHLSSDAYGPMDGKFVSHRLYDMLTDSTVYETTIEQDLKAAMLDPKVAAGAVLGPTMQFMRGVSTLQKTTGLVLTPFASMANLAGSWSMAMMNGNINPKSYAKSMYDTASALRAGITHRPTDGRLPVIQKLLKAKALDSATVGQWQSAMHRDILEQISRLNPESKTFMSDAKKLIMGAFEKSHKGLDAARAAYAWMDVWAKVATFYEKEKYLTDYYKAEGIPKTEEQITREAGYETSKTNISYDMAIPIFRLLERNFSPIFMFATFTSECFRATAQSYAQVFRDIARARNAKTLEGARLARTAALKRLGGTLAVTVGLNAMFMHIINGESDKDKAKRNLDAPWEKTDVSIPIGVDSKGNEHRIGLSRFDPIGPVNEMFRGVMLAKTPEDMHQAMVNGVTQFFIVSRTAAAMTHVARDVLAHSVALSEWDKARKKDTILERNFPEAYQKLVNTLQAGDVGENLSELLDTVIPGPVRSIADPENAKVVKVRPGDWGPGADVMTALGGKTYVRDPDKSMTFRIMDYTKGMTALKKEKQAFLDKQSTLDPNTILTKLNDLRDQERTLYSNLSTAYTGYLAYDKTPADVQKVFKDSPRLTAIGKANLLTGTFRSELTDSKSLVTWYKKSMKEAGTPEERDSIRNKYTLLRKLYSQENSN